MSPQKRKPLEGISTEYKIKQKVNNDAGDNFFSFKIFPQKTYSINLPHSVKFSSNHIPKYKNFKHLKKFFLDKKTLLLSTVYIIKNFISNLCSSKINVRFSFYLSIEINELYKPIHVDLHLYMLLEVFKCMQLQLQRFLLLRCVSNERKKITKRYLCRNLTESINHS